MLPMSSFETVRDLRDRLKVALSASPRLYDLARRPYALGRYALRKPHDPDYRVFALFTDRSGMFLDIGANAGMSALSFRLYNRRSPILSIEPNPFHEGDLRFVGRFVQPFDYRIMAAGDREDAGTLFVPSYRGVPFTTEASLVRDEVVHSPSLRDRLGPRMDSPDFEIAACPVRIAPLDELRLSPDFIKVDVQGFERRALEGLADTLERSKPVLLIEAPDQRLRTWLAERGYRARRYRPRTHDLNGELWGSGNLVFLPASP
jgi:FkbM family methyltransferase